MVTFELATTDFYVLDSDVERRSVAMDESRSVRSRLSSLRQLRRIHRAERYDAVLVLGWATNVLTLLALIGTRNRVIISERIDPRHHRISWRWKLAQRLTYPLAFRLVVQTEAVARVMRRWVLPGRIRVVGNIAPVHPGPRAGVGSPHRSSPSAGCLIRRDSTYWCAPSLTVRRTVSDVRLDIIGEGPARVVSGTWSPSSTGGDGHPRWRGH